MKVIDYPDETPVSDFRTLKGQCINRTLAYAASRFQSGLTGDDIRNTRNCELESWVQTFVRHLGYDVINEENPQTQGRCDYFNDRESGSFLARLNHLTASADVVWKREFMARQPRDDVVNAYAELPIICLYLTCPELSLEGRIVDPIHFCCAEYGVVRDWTGAVFATSPSLVESIFIPSCTVGLD